MTVHNVYVYILKFIYDCLAKQFFLFAGKSCPGGEIPCSGNGQCDPTTGFCNCQEGHQGSDCSGNINFIKCTLPNYLSKVFDFLINWYSRIHMPRRL